MKFKIGDYYRLDNKYWNNIIGRIIKSKPIPILLTLNANYNGHFIYLNGGGGLTKLSNDEVMVELL